MTKIKRYENPEKYDVAVIGGGHAGIEAALAAARLGMRTVIFSINIDTVGNMPCNPSIGGTGKGHLVRELDALGGEMGKIADKTSIQTRMLNRGKGAAVFSLRAQINRRAYQNKMKQVLEKTPLLDLRQAEIVAVDRKKDGTFGVVTMLGAVFSARAVIIATGTYLKGTCHIGEVSYEGGPDGTFAANSLSASLKKLGIPLRRFKTGTPCRINRSTVDLSVMERQEGDPLPEAFSFETKKQPKNVSDCFVTYTNPETHRIILENLDRSPLYAGRIEGVGPRYCPSIEDKVVRFADRERHQLFVEPMGEDTDEMYLQGMSSSLPEEVQLRMVRSVKGLENAIFMRTGYAIEYDCTDPLELSHTLEFKNVPGIYGAGQFNGTSGYEEAAAQGLVAGVNAALKLKGAEPMILTRENSYIGTLIDDLVTCGTNEPYRMMTSRSEYRLTLRQDNADERLSPIGYAVGLLPKSRYKKFLAKYERVEKEEKRLKKTVLPPSAELRELMEKAGTAPATTGMTLAELLRRPELSYEALTPFDVNRPDLERAEWEEAVIRIRYEGYIARQNSQIAQAKKAEHLRLDNIDYDDVYGLRIEARAKLKKIRPMNIGQAARIPGVNPADITLLLIYLKKGH